MSLEIEQLKRRIQELEAKGETAWAKLSDKGKMIVACVTVAAVVWLLVKTHIL